ncbi:unnamed protein product, partial [Schistosoma margrebowiei]
DDSWKSFFRRLTFSPDGLLLVCPSGNLEEAAFAGLTNSTIISSTNGFEQPDKIVDTTIPLVAPQHAAHIFVRSNFTRPVVSLPTGSKPVVAVRFCPQPFQLRQVNLNYQNDTNQYSSLFNLAYRWLFCLVLEDSVLFYDTQQTVPFAQVSQLHYQALNDATWSKDGHLVVICSTDGYCSLIHFAHGELGAFYRGTFGAPNSQAISIDNAVRETDKCQINEVEMLSSVVGDAINDAVNEAYNPPKSNVSSATVPDSNKLTTEAKSSESSINNNPIVVDGATTVSKQKRRVQLTTLVSFSDGNITNNGRTDNSQISKNLPNDSDFRPTDPKSYKFEERDVIEIECFKCGDTGHIQSVCDTIVHLAATINSCNSDSVMLSIYNDNLFSSTISKDSKEYGFSDEIPYKSDENMLNETRHGGKTIVVLTNADFLNDPILFNDLLEKFEETLSEESNYDVISNIICPHNAFVT